MNRGRTLHFRCAVAGNSLLQQLTCIRRPFVPLRVVFFKGLAVKIRSCLRFVSAAILLLVAGGSGRPFAQGGNTVSLTALNVPYAQDFNTLASSGTSSITPTGWFFSETGGNANALYTAGTGSSNAGDTYSFGAASATERAFGGLRSGALIPVIGASFTNNTSATLSLLNISYTGEHWRAGVASRGASDRIDFQYSLDATSLTTGTWVDVDALDFATPATGTISAAGAIDGNNASFRTLVAGSISGLLLANGATVWIRWTDFDISSSDDGLAVDDFSITPHAGPTVSIDDVSIQEGNGGTFDANFTVTVSGRITASRSTSRPPTEPAPPPPRPRAATTSHAANPRSPFRPARRATRSPSRQQRHTFERDETFLVKLSNVSGATLARRGGLGTIVNDDEPPPVEPPTSSSARSTAAAATRARRSRTTSSSCSTAARRR